MESFVNILECLWKIWSTSTEARLKYSTLVFIKLIGYLNMVSGLHLSLFKECCKFVYSKKKIKYNFYGVNFIYFPKLLG